MSVSWYSEIRNLNGNWPLKRLVFGYIRFDHQIFTYFGGTESSATNVFLSPPSFLPGKYLRSPCFLGWMQMLCRSPDCRDLNIPDGRFLLFFMDRLFQKLCVDHITMIHYHDGAKIPQKLECVRSEDFCSCRFNLMNSGFVSSGTLSLFSNVCLNLFLPCRLAP